MINPESIDLSTLPCVALSERNALPSTSGIYFAIDAYGVVQYIGKAVNIQQRWLTHHRYAQLKDYQSVKIAYLAVSDPELLLPIESALIDWFDPSLNGSEVLRGVQEPCDIKWNLAHIMFDRGMKTGELSEMTGLHPNTISKLKAQREMPSRLDRKTLEGLCKALKCLPGELLTYEPSDQP